MKNTMLKIVALALTFVLCFGLTACFGGGGEEGAKLSTEVYEGDVIYVGNTADTTADPTIGVPFNLGIEAAFAAYNAKGGFNGKTVALKTYSDGGDGAQALTLMEKLVYEDDIFAIVGNYGSYAVTTNLSVLKENCVPMIYAAAGNTVLFNENATSDPDRAIFPVQPINYTEGQMLLLRAFAPTHNEKEEFVGGIGGTKVGVISNSDEASQGMLAGIKAEADRLNLGSDKVIYQNVVTDDYSAAAAALQAEGCDVIIVTVTRQPFMSALVALANVNYTKSVLTTYNNSNAAIFNDASSNMTETAIEILSKMQVYAQAWLDISANPIHYSDPDSALFRGYKFIGKTVMDENGVAGVPGFSAEYWEVANDIFDYATSLNDKKISPFNMSYNSYALAGYIAGDLFCQALEAMEAEGMELTRANLVTVLESKEFKVAMADMISFQNGKRTGVQKFSLTWFYDAYNFYPEGTPENEKSHTASSMTLYPLTSLEEYRALIGK